MCLLLEAALTIDKRRSRTRALSTSAPYSTHRADTVARLHNDGLHHILKPIT
jgi:hypothetical protein